MTALRRTGTGLNLLLGGKSYHGCKGEPMSASVTKIHLRLVAASSPPKDQRWHPAARAVTMVGLGALAWMPVVAAGWLILG